MCVHMAHGLNSVLKRGPIALSHNNNNNSGKNENNHGKTGIGSRRIFAPHFKLQVLDSYRNDADCKGNQRATARKYGIHRRQIQKWLQVENNLRNSVGQIKNDNNNNNHHNHENNKGQEQRVPALVPSPAPLDYTTNHHNYNRSSPRVASPGASIIAPAPDPATPIDLSLKRAINAPAAAAVTPPPPPPLFIHHHQQQQEQQVVSPPSLLQPHPDVWDLSTNNKRKFQEDLESPPITTTTTTTKTVKLFKPYLDDVFDSCIVVETTTTTPCCSSTTDYYPQQHHQQQQDTYILHELQPKSSMNYHYYQQFSNCCDYDVTSTTTQTTYEEPNYMVPLKQRHQYSLDFKLSAIECYYQDTICKGNQRAVASKYNINRRQVQKWLKQADELKQRNETIKHTQIVR